MINRRFGFYELFWLSGKWIALSQVIRHHNRSRSKVYACSGSLKKSFGSLNLQFQHKAWYLTSRNQCCDVQNVLECSLAIWFDSETMDNFKIIPILAGLMVAHTSIFHSSSIKTNNIQSDHWQKGLRGREFVVHVNAMSILILKIIFKFCIVQF